MHNSEGMYDIVSIGSATQDVCLSADNFHILESDDFSVGKGICLPFSSKVQIQNLVFASGGGGTNAAVTFARQGYRTACLGVIGQDANGSLILDELRRESVDGKYFQVHNEDSTADSVVLVSRGGERTILSYKGAGIHWDVSAIPWEQIRSKWLYVNSLGGHAEVLERIVAESKKHGTHLVTNPGSQEIELGLERLAPLWSRFDIVGMNQEEAAAIAGVPYHETDRIFRVMDDAIGGILIMTQGSRGVMVSDGTYRYSAGIPNREVVDRTGAGDAFHSAFIAEFIRSGSIERSIQMGTANSTSVVARYGAKEGILHKGDIGAQPLVRVERVLLK